jgi:hypothetical protein
MLGGSVYKDHIFNKETAYITHENSTIHLTNFHNTIQYKYINIHSAIQVHAHKYNTSTLRTNYEETSQRRRPNIGLLRDDTRRSR